MKKNKTVLNLRKNKKLKIDTNNNINMISDNNRKKHKLSCKNNKSSGCITPGSFNPLINYKYNDKNNKPRNSSHFYKNKDHFYHMNPTVLHTYKPLIKRNSNINNLAQKEKRKSGKKLFGLKNVESKEECTGRNTFKNRFIYLNNILMNFRGNNKKIYEYNAPVISHKNYKGINMI